MKIYATRRGIRLGSLTLGLTLGLATACTDSPTNPTVAPDDAVPVGIALSETAVLCESLTQTFQVDAQVLDAKGRTIEGVPLVWTVPDDGIVEAGATSGFVCLANGTTSLQVTVSEDYPIVGPDGYGGERPTASLPVTVEQRPVALELGGEVFAAAQDGIMRLWSLGQSMELSVWSVDGMGHAVAEVDDAMTWDVEEESVGSVSASGLVTALDHGVTAIHVEHGSLSGTVHLHVQARLTLTACLTSGNGGSGQTCGDVTITFTEGGN